MRVLRLLLIAALIVWAFATLGFVRWIRERYGRGGPIPVSQAGMLLSPLRRLIDPVGATMQRFRIERGDTVLELGPGPGYFTAGAAEAVGAGGRVLCLDLQVGMLRLLQERLDGQRVDNACPVAADACRLPLPDASVDAAFLITVLGEIPDRVTALHELRRVLKPGGVLSFRETLGDPDYVFEATMRDLCRACGFEPLSHDRLPLGYAMSFTRP